MANQLIKPKIFVSFLIVAITLCNFSQTIVSKQKIGGLRLRLMHRDSPDSPLYEPGLTNVERIKRLRDISKARIHNLYSKFSNSTQVKLHPDSVIRPQLLKEDIIYVLEIGIGTFNTNPPYRNYYLVFDTGGNNIWTQCEGCTVCFPQRDPRFPRNGSQTYHAFPCKQCPAGTQCVRDHCNIKKIYGGGCRMKGIMATEKFTFKSVSGQVETVPDITFACGIEVRDFEPGENPGNIVSGIAGMGLHPNSLASQLARRTNGQFSYCLQPPQNHGASPMYVSFGDGIVRPPGLVSTPFVQQRSSNHYHLSLHDISVAGVRLNIPSNVFAIRPDGTGGTIIDSGCASSFITGDAYHILRDAVAASVEHHNPNLVRAVPARHLRLDYDLCWKRVRGPSQVYTPGVTFHFDNNADMVIPNVGVFSMYTSKGRDWYCFDMLESQHRIKGYTLIGAFQQANQRIIYDLPGQRLLFAPENCNLAY